jgi:MATE family multidrug resistance protein
MRDQAQSMMRDQAQSTAASDAAAARPRERVWSAPAVREVWAIAWPTVLTMTSYTVMQFIDKLMVAQVGPLEVAAQGNGGIWAFNLMAITMGLLTVINTYVAQNLGAGRPEEGSRYAWAGLWLSLGAWALVLVPFALLLPWIFAAMGHEPRLQELETQYGQIVLVGSLMLLANKSMSHYFFGMHRPKVIALAALMANGLNVVLNYFLIYGEQGLPALGLPGVPGTPALGLAGAAIATVLGTTVELAIPLAYFLGPSMNRQFHTRRAWRLDLAAVRDLMRLGWPASLQWGSEIVCWSVFMSVLVGQFGTDHMTAAWAVLTYMHLSFMPAVGFSSAVAAIVGKRIGEGLPDVAAARARLGLQLAMVYVTLCAVVMVVFRESLVSIFAGGPGTPPDRVAMIVAIGTRLMLCAALFQTMDAVGVVCTGALRGAGDTVWPGVVTFILSWVFIVGGGQAFVWMFPGLESLGPWIGASIYIILFGITMFLRWESGRWRQMNVIDRGHRDAALAVPLPGAPGVAGDDAVEDLAADVAAEVLRHRSGDRPSFPG